jgi:glycine dehydrogenase
MEPPSQADAAERRTPLAALERHDAFIGRHIGASPEAQASMLEAIGFASRGALIDAVVPPAIRLRQSQPLGAPMSETEALARRAEMAGRNRVLK